MSGKLLIAIIIVLGMLSLVANDSDVNFQLIDDDFSLGNTSTNGSESRDYNDSTYKVRLRKEGAYATDYHDEYVVIENDRKSMPVVITDWTIKSEVTGKKAKIGEGAYLPNFTNKEKLSPILLGPGQKAIISTMPFVGGDSFLINKCTGYLAQTREFRPYLSRECPYPKNENLEQFGIVFKKEDTDDDGKYDYDECLDVIERAPRCERISTNRGLSEECKYFIREYINYDGCVKLHKDDEDFLGNEWRVYLNSTKELWRKERETINLYDPNNNLIDSISY